MLIQSCKQNTKTSSETHTHTHTDYHHNWPERRDYAQIKIRMHTNKDYSRLSCHSWQVLLIKAEALTFTCSFATPFPEEPVLLLGQFLVTEVPLKYISSLRFEFASAHEPLRLFAKPLNSSPQYWDLIHMDFKGSWRALLSFYADQL